MEFIIATGNKGKVKDFNLILNKLGHSAISLKDIGVEMDVEETGKTFMENAYLKAKSIYDIIKKPVIADDSGLCVKALNGRPGVYSARYGGEGLTDKDRCLKLLDEMETIEDREAKFVCSICAILSDNDVIETEGEVCGSLLYEMKGNNGFGYDPMFFVKEYNKTFGELSDNEKNSISHRRKALDRFVEILKEKGV